MKNGENILDYSRGENEITIQASKPFSEMNHCAVEMRALEIIPCIFESNCGTSPLSRKASDTNICQSTQIDTAVYKGRNDHCIR